MFISIKLWGTECILKLHFITFKRTDTRCLACFFFICKTLIMVMLWEMLMFLTLASLLETCQQLQLFWLFFLKSWTYFKDELVNSTTRCKTVQRTAHCNCWNWLLERPVDFSNLCWGCKALQSVECSIQHLVPGNASPFPCWFHFYSGFIPDFQILFLPFPSPQFM